MAERDVSAIVLSVWDSSENIGLSTRDYLVGPESGLKVEVYLPRCCILGRPNIWLETRATSCEEIEGHQNQQHAAVSIFI